MHINLPSKLRCDYLCSTCGYRGSVEYNDPDAIAEPEPIPGATASADAPGPAGAE